MLTVTVVGPDGVPSVIERRDLALAQKAGFREVSEVVGFTRDNERIALPEYAVQDLIQRGGRLATPEERAKAELDQEGVSEFSQKARSLGAGLARGVFAGLEVPLVGALAGATDREKEIAKQLLERDKEAHPNYATAGTIAGIVAPAIVTGGLSTEAQVGVQGSALAARAATAARFATPALGIARMGEYAAAGGRMAAQALGASTETVLGRAAIKAAELGASGAVEGALFAGGEAAGDVLASPQSLADNSDKILAAMGTGALWGGLSGAALGGGGSLVASGGRAVSRGASNAAQSIARMTRSLTSASEEAAGAEVAAGAKAAQRAELGAITPQGMQVIDDAKKTIGEVYSDAIALAKTPDAQRKLASEMAYGQVFRGTGLQSTQIQKTLAANKISRQELGDFILREGIIDTKAAASQVIKDASFETIAERVESSRINALNKMIAISDSVEAAIPVQKIANAFDRAAKTYEGNSFARAEVNALKKEKDAFLKTFAASADEAAGLETMSLRDFITLRSNLDRNIRRGGGFTTKDNAAKEALRSLRSELENIETNIIAENTAAVSTPEGIQAARDAYKMAKREYQLAKIIQDQTEESAARADKGAFFGLRDAIQSNVGASVGAAMGGALFGPIGAAAGGTVGGVVGGVGAKLARERGSAAAAVMLHRMAANGSLTSVVNAVDSQVRRAASVFVNAQSQPQRNVTRAVRKALGAVAPQLSSENAVYAIAASQGATSSERRAKKQSLQVAEGSRQVVKRAEQFENLLAKAQASPDMIEARINAVLAPIRADNPRLANSLSRSMRVALVFLANKVPQRESVDPLNLQKRVAMNAIEAEKFLRYVDYVNRPMLVIEHLERGKVTREGVETLQAIAPNVYESLQAATMEAVATQQAEGKEISYETRLRLGILMNVPTDASLRPQTMEFLQGNTAQAVAETEAKGQQSAQPSAPSRPIKLSSQMSKLDSIAEKGPGR